MGQKITFTQSELEEAHKVLIKNGITDEEKRDERIRLAQERGYEAIFAYGSLLHTVHTDKGITQSSAFVRGMAARFNLAFNYYGGEEGLPMLMLGLELMEGEVTHGAIQHVKFKAAQDFIDFYDHLQVRENPVNNPIYKFDEFIEVETASGEKETCIACLANKEGPLYFGNALSEDEIASIFAHALGPPHRLDNGTFRNGGGVELLDLQGHQLTAAAYVYYYLQSYQAWGFPRNDYLERINDKINRVRRDMDPESRAMLEKIENQSERPEGLAPRYNGASSDDITRHEETFHDFLSALNKLNEILLSRSAYRNWQREWDVPQAF